MSSHPLEVGDQAPPFSATAVGGRYGAGAIVNSEQLRGRTVVLYFYPKDSTPGCTVQACELRDQWERFEPRAELFGVSVDSVKSHQKFIDKQGLPFPLLSDPDQVLVNAYGMWVEKSLYGRKYMGTERSTVVIGPDGRIQAILRKVKPAEHAAQLLAAL